MLWPIREKLNNLDLNRLLLYFFLLFASACGVEQKIKTPNTYYDLNGLIDEQIKLLDSISPVLFKKAIIDENSELVELTPNDSVWSREFLIFRSADINKPMLVNRYNVDEHTTNDGSKRITYISKDPEKTEVDSLMIHYFAESEKPSIIHASLSHNNALFRNQKTLDMFFKKSENLISTYKIRGWQKMISKDSTFYYVEGKINGL